MKVRGAVFKAMGRLFRKTETKTTGVETHDARLNVFGGSPTTAGITIGPETALQCPAVFCAVRVIAETISELPIHLYKRTSAGKERAVDHPAYKLVHDFPAPWISAPEFLLDLSTQLLLTGNAFAHIGRGGNDQPVEMIPLPSSSVSITTAPTWEPVYTVALSDGTSRTYGPGELLHIKTLGTRPNVGLSPVTLGREAIALGMVLERYAAALFGRGARPSSYLKYSKLLDHSMVERIKASLAISHTGHEGAGRTMVLEDGMSFEQLQMTSTDAQFLELRRHQISEIGRVFRVPLTFLMDYDRATWGNSEAMNQQFLTHTLMPHLRLWQGALAKALLTEEERETHYFEFLTDELLKADIAARFTAYTQAVSNGILNPNEVRGRENLAPYNGGDEYRRPMNTETPDAAP